MNGGEIVREMAVGNGRLDMLTEGYLVIFDPGKKKWEQKIYYKDIVYNDKKIFMVGL